MIRKLRRRHLHASLVLTVFLPVGFVAGLLVRPDMPALDGAAPGRPQPLTGHLVWESETHWGDLPIATRRWVGGPPPGGNSLQIEVREDLAKPDLLLYWSHSDVGADALPEGAYLLGSVPGAGTHVYDVPEGHLEEGELLLYSLGHQEIVGRAEVTGR